MLDVDCFFLTLPLFGFLLVLFTSLLLRLHDVVHQIIDVLIIHLLVGVVKLSTLLAGLTILLRLPLVRRSFLLRAPLPLGPQKLVVRYLTMVGLAPTHAFSIVHRTLMIRKLVAIRKRVFARTIVCSVRTLIVAVLRIVAHLLLVIRLLLTFQLLLFRREVRPSVLIQVKVEGLTLVEVFVGLWDRVAIVLDLLNLVKVLRQGFTRVRRIVPPLGFVDDGRDCLVLNHCADVD